MDVDLWASCGQSNAWGAGTGASAPVPNALMTLEYDPAVGLIPLKEPTSYSSNYTPGTGSAWPSCLKQLEATGRKNVLVRCASGGAALLAVNAAPISGRNFGHWSETGTRFPDAINRIKAAITAIESAGDTVARINILWHQGERDAQQGNSLGSFQAAFQNLVSRFRTALDDELVGLPPLKIYVARIGTASGLYSGDTALLARMATVRGYQDAGCAAEEGLEMAYTDCVNFPTKTPSWMKSDGAHYTQTGYNDMGFDMGNFILDDLGEEEPPPDPDPIAIFKRGSRTALRLLRCLNSAPPPSGSAVAFRSAGAQKAFTNATACEIPAGVVNKDVVIMAQWAANASAVFTWPAGFTEFANKVQGASVLALAWKRASGAESGNYTVGVAGTTNFTSQAFAFSGCVETGSPIRDFITNGAAGTEPNLSLAGVPGGDELFYALGINHGSLSLTSPATYADRNSTGLRINIATKDQVSTGDTGNVNGGVSSGSLPIANILVALKSSL